MSATYFGKPVKQAIKQNTQIFKVKLQLFSETCD